MANFVTNFLYRHEKKLAKTNKQTKGHGERYQQLTYIQTRALAAYIYPLLNGDIFASWFTAIRGYCDNFDSAHDGYHCFEIKHNINMTWLSLFQVNLS